jgi:transposase
MLYLGLDAHSKWMVVKGFDPDSGDTVLLNRVDNDHQSLKEAFEKLEGPLYGAMESGTNAWAVYRQIEKYFEKLIVVDPATVWGREIRRGAKTDKRDAMKLAVKLSRGELEGLYIPDPRTQDLRNLGRAKIHASRMVTKLVNEIGSLLKSWGIVLDCSLLSKRGQQLLVQSKSELPELSRMILEHWLAMLAKAQEVEISLEKTIDDEAQRDESCKRLMTIPGVGSFTALVVRAEIGDIDRFPTFTHLISYCGLAPRVVSSADRLYYGHLSRFCNKFLKYVLLLRAQSFSQMKADNALKKTYWRVTIKKHRNEAKVAVARQLVKIIYSMLKNGQDWDPSRYLAQRSCIAAAVG